MCSIGDLSWNKAEKSVILNREMICDEQSEARGNLRVWGIGFLGLF
jgi:hypothetical protein